MRKVTVWDFFNASHTVTACGSVRRRIGPARIRGNVGNRSAIGVQDMIELLCHERVNPHYVFQSVAWLYSLLLTFMHFHEYVLSVQCIRRALLPLQTY